MKKTKMIQKIEAKGSSLAIYAKSLIVTKDNIKEVNEKLLYCKDATKKINKFMEKHVDVPYAKYKVGFDIRKDMLSDFVSFKKVAGLKSSEYETEEARKKAELERIAEEKRQKEEDDLKQKALDDAKVLEDAKQKILDDAKILEDAGKTKQAEKLKEESEVLNEKAEEIRQEAEMIFVPVKTVEKTSSKVKGISYVDFTEIEIVNQKSFLQTALVNNYDLFESCINIDIPKLRKIIEANKLEKFSGLKIEKIKKQRG